MLADLMIPTEALAALAAGADALKLFPGEAIPPKVVKAMRAVLPAGTHRLAMGGVTPETMAPMWRPASPASAWGPGSTRRA